MKTWYSCTIPIGCSIADVYASFHSGELDHNLLYLKSIIKTAVVVKVGKSRNDVTSVNFDYQVAEVYGLCCGHEIPECERKSEVGELDYILLEVFFADSLVDQECGDESALRCNSHKN